MKPSYHGHLNHGADTHRRKTSCSQSTMMVEKLLGSGGRIFWYERPNAWVGDAISYQWWRTPSPTQSSAYADRSKRQPPVGLASDSSEYLLIRLLSWVCDKGGTGLSPAKASHRQPATATATQGTAALHVIPPVLTRPAGATKAQSERRFPLALPTSTARRL